MKSAGFISGGRIRVFESLIFKTKDSSFFVGMIMVRGGGQVSSSVTTGGMPVIVTGGFTVSGLIEVLTSPRSFEWQEKFIARTTTKKKCRTKE
jgi:hypothetical protein